MSHNKIGNTPVVLLAFLPPGCGREWNVSAAAQYLLHLFTVCFSALGPIKVRELVLDIYLSVLPGNKPFPSLQTTSLHTGMWPVSHDFPALSCSLLRAGTGFELGWQ